MQAHPRALALCAGILAANATPHAYAAGVRTAQLTPLRGRNSGPVVNAVWSAMNAAGALALLRTLPPGDGAQRRAFRAGVVGFAAWALVSEWVTGLNE